ncbi:MAG: Proline--tRNA ligase [Burkholderia sp.]|jgi:prolyl-tRNA editing enzyme YbaK/EbsC (Cys-tRNA(Pro) deacylase)
MSFEAARKHLEAKGFADRIRVLDKSSATVALAAEALGTAPEHIAKTLSFLQGEKPVLIVFAGTARIDNHKYKQRFATKAKMIPFEDVERLVGHHPGGVCPFGVLPGVEVWLDESLRRYETIYPACGSENSAVRLTPDELEKASDAKGWVDVSKTPEA